MLINLLLRMFDKTTLRKAQKVLGRPVSLLESVIWGGRLRESLLLRMLSSHYRSVERRHYLYSEHPPHFTHHHLGFFRLGFSTNRVDCSTFNRAFLSAQVIRSGDTVLDIGCGDG